jgi:predicted dehydrogenase
MPIASRARLAVVGLGRIGRLHANNLATRVGGARLIAVADPVEPLARNVGARHGVPWTTSLERLLGEPSLDGVVIAAPSSVHVELVAQAAAAGRHVFCEKPLGLDADECAAAVAATASTGIALQVGFQRRFDPDWQELKRALDAGAVGALDIFRCSHRNVRPPRTLAGLGDVFADLAVHDLDAARWIGGEVVELSAAMCAGDEAAAVISLRFESGALGLVDLHRSAGYGFECSAELVGSGGVIRCGYAARRGEVELLRDGDAEAALVRDHAERHAAAYVAELEHFASVAAGQVEPGVGGDDAIAALRLADVARRSASVRASLPVTEPTAHAI